MGCCCAKEDESPDSPDGKKQTSLRSPINNRTCTDIPVLILFVLFWCGMIFVAAYSVFLGDAFRLVFGYDSYGDTCGRLNPSKIANISLSGKDLTDKPYVFFMNVWNPHNSLAVCVSKCPGKTLHNLMEVQQFSNSTGSQLCDYNIPVDMYYDYVAGRPNQGQGLRGPCPITPVPASEVFLNRCIPKNIGSFGQNVSNSIIGFLSQSNFISQVFSDLFYGWKYILMLCFVALIIAGILVVLMRFLASIVVYLIVVIAALGSVAGTAFLWWTYAMKKQAMDDQYNQKIPFLKIDIESETAFLVYSIIATVLTVILLIVLIVMRKRIALVVTLFHEAGKCIIAVPTLLIQPIWTFIFLMLFFVYTIGIFAFLGTAGKAVPDKRQQFVTYEAPALVTYFWWYHLFGSIWMYEFILACQQMAIAGAVATWYFTRDKTTISCAVGKSVCRLISHHMGSVACGAFIITLVKFPRYVLMYIHEKTKGSANECAKFTLKCCMCCLWCLEKCLKFLNQNAYTVIAINGTSFCPSAKKAFMVILNNVLRVAAINSVGDFVLFLGKIGVTAATGAISVLVLRENKELNFYFIPVLIVCIFAYFIAHCFLSIYEMIIDCLLLCFCEDCQANDGSDERPYFMDKSLMEFVKNSSEALEKLNKRKKKADDAEDKVDGEEMEAVEAQPLKAEQIQVESG